MNTLGIFLFVSGPQVAIIVVVILLLFGGKKIPELMRGLGSGLKEFKKAKEDLDDDTDDKEKKDDKK